MSNYHSPGQSVSGNPFKEIWFVGIIVALCLFKLWIQSALPLNASMYHLHDQAWFITRAISIASGDWLGDQYNHYTLIKGPGFPITLALISKLGISPRLAFDVLYVLASVAFLIALRHFFRNKITLLIGFTLVLFNPITYTVAWSDLLRQSLYLPLVLLCLSALIGLVKYDFEQRTSGKIGATAWACLFGFGLGLAWITREESIWLVAAATPVLLFLVIEAIRKKTVRPLVPLSIIAIIFSGIVGSVALTNYHHYGYFGVVDLKEKEFSRAWDAVLSLNTSQTAWHQHFTVETRDKLLQISPRTALLIQDRLKPNGEFKRRPNGIAGSQGIWAMRSAVENNGYYRDFKRTRNHLSAIADDIEQYCANNPGQCVQPVFSKVLWKHAHIAAVFPTSYQVFLKFIQYAYSGYTPKDLSAGSIKGDANFIDGLTRFFNLVPGTLKMYRKTGNGSAISQDSRWTNIEWIFLFYKHSLGILIIISLLSIATLPFSRKKGSHGTNLMILGGGFFSIFGICVLVTLTAYTQVGRPLMSASIPLLTFVAYSICMAANCLSQNQLPDNIGRKNP